MQPTSPDKPSFVARARQQQARNGPTCTVRLLLESLDPEYRAEVEDAIRAPGINATTICALLAADGHRIGPDALRRHRVTMSGGPGCACRT
jgi:hypothetical protein